MDKTSGQIIKEMLWKFATGEEVAATKEQK